jgi:hypothetical protein
LGSPACPNCDAGQRHVILGSRGPGREGGRRARRRDWRGCAGGRRRWPAREWPPRAAAAAHGGGECVANDDDDEEEEEKKKRRRRRRRR